ncbi:acyltransferase [Bradyrhizobium diazoefficiens]|nr:acyltransferase family protein [Bradyrhizobium diazoefficiens]MBR0774580.1 acyltransferase [Bradyrhizobium diazoefficiens]
MKYRPDIDVLRTIAVLGVVFFHAGFHIALGGYVGVDMFFVISGYLITRKIAEEVQQGVFSFPAFYVNRARRLFPALFVTVVATFLLSFLLLASDHFKQFAQSAVWTALSASNIYFWLESGYWAADNHLKPLLHMWSLSVEEQFYLVWPFVLYFFARLRAKNTPIALGAIGALSFIASVAYFNIDQDAVFFLTPFRVFEFAVGALLVWLERTSKHRKQMLCNALSILGFCLVVIAMITFRPHTPTSLVIIPCIGTACMIFGGVAPSLERVWNNALGVYVGRISYSVYLVHWPIIVFYEYWRFNQMQQPDRVGLVIASLLLAIPLHHFVEQRYRSGRAEARLNFTVAWGSLSAFIVVFGVAASTMIKPPIRPLSDPWIIERISLPLCEGEFGLCPIDHPDVVLVGDSHAAHYAPAVAETLKEARLRGNLYPIVPGCPFVLDIHAIDVSVKSDDCIRGKLEWLSRITQDNPRVIILAGLWEIGMGRGFGRRYTLDAEQRELKHAKPRLLWAEKMRETVDLLVKTGRNIILLGNGPLVANPPSVCFDRPAFLGRFDCSKMNVIVDPEIHTFTREVLRQIEMSHPGQVFFFDAWPFLCNGDLCPLSDGGQTFYKDQHHLTPYGALWLQHHAFAGLSHFLGAAIQSAQRSPVN